jgi:hypothetical protein
MKTQTISRSIILITSLVTILSIVSCQKNAGSPYGGGVTAKSVVNLYLTDDPSLVFDKVLLDIQKVEIKAEDSAEVENEHQHQAGVDDNDSHGDTTGGWMAVAIHPGVYDILQFRNGLDTLFSAGSFPANRQLEKIRITLGTGNSVVFQGTSFPLTVKGNNNIIVVKVDANTAQINQGGVSNIWMDIDAGNSIRKNGNGFELKASVKVFSKEKAASIEGKVLPKDANAVVMAINGSDTATAKPEDGGEYKFIGLKPGTYSLLFHATANAYLDQTVANVTVQAKDDTKVPTVTLHK